MGGEGARVGLVRGLLGARLTVLRPRNVNEHCIVPAFVACPGEQAIL